MLRTADGSSASGSSPVKRPLSGELRGARLRAVSPDGDSAILNVRGFAVFGGRPSDDRLARSGRIDLHVDRAVDGTPVGPRWEIQPA